jgi:hypothetical protein
VPAGLGAIRRARPSTTFGPAVPDVALSWWLLIETDAGATYRVARGTWGDVRAALIRLRELGVAVTDLDDAGSTSSAGSQATCDSSPIISAPRGLASKCCSGDRGEIVTKTTT